MSTTCTTRSTTCGTTTNSNNNNNKAFNGTTHRIVMNSSFNSRWSRRLTTKKIHDNVRASRNRSYFYAFYVIWLSACTKYVVMDDNSNDNDNSWWLSSSSFGACWLLALLFLFLSKYLLTTTTRTQSSLPRRLQDTKLLVGVLAGIACWVQPTAVQSVAVAVGFLAYDHWFGLLLRIPKSSGWQWAEGIVTLSCMMVVWMEWNSTAAAEDDNSSEGYYNHALIRVWACMSMVRCGIQWSRLNNNKNTKTTTTVKQQQQQPNIWRIRGVEYDVTSFVDQHPGGKQAILMGRGREDCTALFQSYHPFVKRPEQLLHKYRLPSTAAAKTNVTTDHDEFYTLLVQAVKKKLEEHGLDPVRDRAATPQRALYYGVVFCAVFVCAVAHVRGSILGSFLMAFPGWLLGALGHDAGHFAATRNAKFNDYAVWAIFFHGNPFIWQHQHTFAHHSHTNSIDHDTDLHHFVDVLRLHQGVPQANIFRLQSHRLYVLFAYALVSVGTCFFIPWQLVQDGSLYDMVEWTDRKSTWRTAGFYLHIIVYTGAVVFLPFFVHATPGRALAAVVSHVATAGIIFAAFTQIGHLNEASLDPDAVQKRHSQRKNVSLNSSWAVQQIETSNNFCVDSSLWHVLSNGLNLQIEHHLFPGLNHCHLHLIQPTVQGLCEQHGVCYKTYNSWSEIMQATLNWLDRLAVEPELTKSQ